MQRHPLDIVVVSKSLRFVDEIDAAHSAIKTFMVIATNIQIKIFNLLNLFLFFCSCSRAWGRPKVCAHQHIDLFKRHKTQWIRSQKISNWFANGFFEDRGYWAHRSIKSLYLEANRSKKIRLIWSCKKAYLPKQLLLMVLATGKSISQNKFNEFDWVRLSSIGSDKLSRIFNKLDKTTRNLAKSFATKSSKMPKLGAC